MDGSLRSLFLLLAAVCLVIGAVGIANTTLVAVLERTGEIGLRRSLGARPAHIAGQFLSESTVLGTMGGLVGTGLGVLTVLAVTVARYWTAVTEPWTVVAAPFAGSLVGLLAGPTRPCAPPAWNPSTPCAAADPHPRRNPAAPRTASDAATRSARR